MMLRCGLPKLTFAACAQCCLRPIHTKRTKPTSDFEASLTQHHFASAAHLLLERGAGHQSGRSRASISDELKPYFRCDMAGPSGRRTEPPFALVALTDRKSGSLKLATYTRSELCDVTWLINNRHFTERVDARRSVAHATFCDVRAGRLPESQRMDQSPVSTRFQWVWHCWLRFISSQKQ